MPGPNPSPPPDASNTKRGLINTIAQTFAGQKTFAALVVCALGLVVAGTLTADNVAIAPGGTLTLGDGTVLAGAGDLGRGVGAVAVQAKIATTFNLPNTGTLVQLDLATEVEDTDNAAGNTGSEWVFTVPTGKGGRYLVSGLMSGTISTTGGHTIAIAATVNGGAAVDVFGWSGYTLTPQGAFLRADGANVFTLNAGDVVRIYGRSNGAGTLSLTTAELKFLRLNDGAGVQGPKGDPGDLTQAAADTRYINTTGDTMTGPLYVGAGTPGVSQVEVQGSARAYGYVASFGSDSRLLVDNAADTAGNLRTVGGGKVRVGSTGVQGVGPERWLVLAAGNEVDVAGVWATGVRIGDTTKPTEKLEVAGKIKSTTGVDVTGGFSTFVGTSGSGHPLTVTTSEASGSVNNAALSLNHSGGTTPIFNLLAFRRSGVSYGAFALSATEASNGLVSGLTYTPAVGRDFGVRKADGTGFGLKVDGAGRAKVGGGGTLTEAFEVVGNALLSGALQFTGAGTGKPTCASAERGKVWFTQGATGVADTIEVCRKDASDAYAWAAL